MEFYCCCCFNVFYCVLKNSERTGENVAKLKCFKPSGHWSSHWTAPQKTSVYAFCVIFSQTVLISCTCSDWLQCALCCLAVCTVQHLWDPEKLRLCPEAKAILAPYKLPKKCVTRSVFPRERQFLVHSYCRSCSADGFVKIFWIFTPQLERILWPQP